MKTMSLVVCGAIACIWLFGCASQKDVLILDERLRSIERQNRDLQQQYAGLKTRMENEVAQVGLTSQSMESSLRSQYAETSAGMDRMQQDLRLLTGRMEEVEHTLQRRISDKPDDDSRLSDQSDTMQQMVAAQLDRRLTAVEQFLDLKRSPAVPDPKTDRTSETEADIARLTDQQLYARAKQAFDDGRMETARQGFNQLLQRFPQSDLANNAQFWIGETHYRERWYEKAILEYQTVIEKYPKGNKVPAAMLKQGMAFLQLGDEANARLIFRELERTYPQSSEAKVAVAKLNEL